MRVLSIPFVAYILGGLLLIAVVFVWLKDDGAIDHSDISLADNQSVLTVSTPSKKIISEEQQGETVRGDSDDVSFIKKTKKKTNNTKEVLSKEDVSLISGSMLEALNEPLLQPEASVASESVGTTITHDAIDPEVDMPISYETSDESFLPKVDAYADEDSVLLEELMREITVHEKQQAVNKPVAGIEKEQSNLDFVKDIEVLSTLDVPLETSTQLSIQEESLNSRSDLIPKDILLDEVAQ